MGCCCCRTGAGVACGGHTLATTAAHRPLGASRLFGASSCAAFAHLFVLTCSLVCACLCPLVLFAHPTLIHEVSYRTALASASLQMHSIATGGLLVGLARARVCVLFLLVGLSARSQMNSPDTYWSSKYQRTPACLWLCCVSRWGKRGCCEVSPSRPFN